MHKQPRLSNIVDENLLQDFYGLDTLSPTNYGKDTINIKPNIDPSTTDLNSLPREKIYGFLSQGTNTQKVNNKRESDGKAKNIKDPLGFNDSVVDELIDKDIVSDSRDPKSMKYLIWSKSFNSVLFLGMLHGDKSADQLMRSIKYLERDIESKKPLLQKLIAANFTKTLYTKASMDKAFGEFSDSNLTKEIGLLKNALTASSSTTNQLLNPILLQISREEEIKHALESIKRDKDLLDLPSKLQKSIQNKDFDSLYKSYTDGERAYSLSKRSTPNNALLDKVWSKVNLIIEDYKKELWERLGKIRVENVDLNFASSNMEDSPDFVTLITRILQLGADENPIIEFINLQFDYISKDMDNGLSKVQCIRFLKYRKSVLEAYADSISNKHSSSSAKPMHDQIINTALKDVYDMFIINPSPDLQQDSDLESYDLPMVIELWGFLSSYIGEITDDVVVNKILKFSSIVQFFLNEFPRRYGSKVQDSFLEFEGYEKKKMREFFELLIAKVCSHLLFVFQGTEIDFNEALARDSINQEDDKHSSVKTTGSQDSFGFIPPHSNVVSALYFSKKLQRKIFDTFEELKKHTKLLNSKVIDKAINETLKVINRNIVNGALCSLRADVKRLSYMEDWSLSERYDGCTKLPEFLSNYYSFFDVELKELSVIEDKKLFERIQSEFKHSFDYLVENQLEAVITKSNEEPKLKDFYFVTTLSNLLVLKLKTIPRIVQMFDAQFETSLSKSDLKIYSSLEKFEAIIYSEYLKGYKADLKNILGTGVRSTNWYRLKLGKDDDKNISVSSFLLKSINYINRIKSRLLNLKSNKSYIIKVELDLDNYMVHKLIDFLKEIRQFNSDGLFQICVDLRFLCEVFKKLGSSNLKNEVHLSKLQDVTRRFVQKKHDKSGLIESSVKENMQQNEAEIDCFLAS